MGVAVPERERYRRAEAARRRAEAKGTVWIGNKASEPRGARLIHGSAQLSQYMGTRGLGRGCARARDFALVPILEARMPRRGCVRASGW